MAEINGDGKVEPGKGDAGSDDLNRPLIEIEGSGEDGKETLDGLLRRFLAGVLRPEDPSTPIVWRIKASIGDNAPRLKDASRNSAVDVLRWARSGSPLRALLVISVGTIMLLALTGLLVFMLFFLVATFNAIVISFLMSLAAAGGMLALFFAFLTAIYVGALSVAVVVISTITISTIIAVLIATGWVGFFWIVWTVARKSLDLTKQSLSMTGSAISAYRHAHQVVINTN